jgi:hypothetical protein
MSDGDICELLNGLSVRSGCRMRLSRGGAPTYSAGEIAAILRGLPRTHIALAYARYALDSGACEELQQWLRIEAIEEAKRQGLGMTASDEQLSHLAALVRDEAIFDQVRYSGRGRARRLSVSDRAWRERWSGLHAVLLRRVQAWQSDIRLKLARELDGMG